MNQRDQIKIAILLKAKKLIIDKKDNYICDAVRSVMWQHEFQDLYQECGHEIREYIKEKIDYKFSYREWLINKKIITKGISNNSHRLREIRITWIDYMIKQIKDNPQ